MSSVNRENVNGIGYIFGPRNSDSLRGKKLAKVGGLTEIVIDFEYTDLPKLASISYGAATSAASSTAYANIPAGSKIVSAELYILTAFAGGTDLTVGLDRQDNGIAIDTDGLVDATDGAVANLTADNVVTGTGALVGASIGSNAGVIVVDDNGTFTAGKAKLVVTYKPATADV